LGQKTDAPLGAIRWFEDSHRLPSGGGGEENVHRLATRGYVGGGEENVHRLATRGYVGGGEGNVHRLATRGYVGSVSHGTPKG
jgi:hypothetical protein